MEKQRYVNTKFWDDAYIENLKPIERYLFMYFLTNPHTTLCGAYEITLKKIVSETGVPILKVQQTLEKFSLGEKIYYFDGYIYVKNFVKHQSNHPNIKKGIENSLNELPPEILNKIKAINKGVHAVPTASDAIPTASLSTSTSTSTSESTSKHSDGVAGKEINEIIYLFKPVNPTIERCFPNKTERAATERMLKAYGREGVEEMIASLPVVNAKPYWPKSTTPTQLERNIPIYKAKNDESKNQKSKTKATIIS